MNYDKRVKKVIDYIGENLDEDLPLDKLSQVACVSKYHFHRLFSALTGLSIHQYIRWLRLKRAAHQLGIERDKPILDIAIRARFESHEAFARAFKKACGLSPKQFRASPTWQSWGEIPYMVPNRGESKMKVDIKNMPERRLAVVEHRGSVEMLADSFNTLKDWVESPNRHLQFMPGESFGFAYDDPKTTAPEDFRFDLGISVPKNMKINNEVCEKTLPAGRYAVAIHKGSRDNIGDTVYALYRDWLPSSGETLEDSLPCIFCYHNFDHEVAETELLTECWLLLK